MLNLKKAASQLIVEFHRETTSEVLLSFQKELKMAKVSVRLSELDYTFRVNFYLSNNSPDSKSVLKKYTSKPTAQSTLSLLYLNESVPITVLSNFPAPSTKTIMLREALPKIIQFGYEVQNTQDEKESLEYLIDTVKILVESESIAELSLFDQQTQLKSLKNANNPEKVWLAMLYQLPGIGVEKAETIASAYPTVQKLYQGIEKNELENLPVRRGDKLSKLGPALTEKIVRVFTSRSPDELV